MARVLLIEDMHTLRVMLAGVLAKAGHEVVQAGEGVEGLRLARQSAFDLVITDLIMPGKDGIETITELRRDNPDLPILAMSGGGRMDASTYLTLASHLGASRAITKPFLPEQLVLHVAELLGVRAA